jgi:DNA-directed RNA polymerase specialized sigma24 family protein
MDSGSVTHWIKQIKEGGESLAEQELWDRYFSRLAALARRKLEDLPPHVRDEEDLALSALNTLFVRAKQGCFPQLHDRTDLWRLLAAITVRKSIDRRRNSRAEKRGSGQVHDGSGFEATLRDVAVSEPTPDMLAAVNEECQRLMGALGKELRLVARMKLEGYTNGEIAKVLGRVERTIERKLDRIRHTWSKGLEVS